MLARRPHTAYTADQLVRKLPGWKPAPPGKDGVVEEVEEPKQPKIPEFAISKQFDFISKDMTDNVRQ